MFASTTRNDLLDHLGEVGLKEGMDVIVHSRLLAFGKVEGSPAETVYLAIRDIVGPDATIVVPTYTFSIDSETPFDRLQGPSTHTGVLSEYVRQLPGAERSATAIHSHAAVGPKAGLLLASPATISLGPGSDFEMFANSGFNLLLLGCDFPLGGTYVHHVEAMVGVPYRTWLDLKRVVVSADGKNEDVIVRYYGRKGDWDGDFTRINKLILDGDGDVLMGAAAAAYGHSYLMDLQDLDKYVRAAIDQDPYALAKRQDDD